MTAKINRIVTTTLFGLLASTVPVASQAATAEENFQWYCVQCHGKDGSGDGVNSTVKELPVGPMNLSEPKEMKKFSNDQIIKTLTEGGPANQLESLMPPWGNRLTADEIKKLMGFVRSLCKGAECPKE